MKFFVIAILMTLNLVTPVAFAQNEVKELTRSEKLTQLFQIQEEVQDLKQQIKEQKRVVRNNKRIRNGAIIIAAGSALVAFIANRSMYKVNAASPSELGPLINTYFAGGAASVIAVSIGGYQHYRLNLNETQLTALEARLNRIQAKLNVAIAKFN